jgi:hypothetical protein
LNLHLTSKLDLRITLTRELAAAVKIVYIMDTLFLIGGI